MSNRQNHIHVVLPAQSPSPEEIRATRKAAGLSQTSAAALIYCTLRGWQEWEAGNRKMHPAFWELFIKKLPPKKPGRCSWKKT